MIAHLSPSRYIILCAYIYICIHTGTHVPSNIWFRNQNVNTSNPIYSLACFTRLLYIVNTLDCTYSYFMHQLKMYVWIYHPTTPPQELYGAIVGIRHTLMSNTQQWGKLTASNPPVRPHACNCQSDGGDLTWLAFSLSNAPWWVGQLFYVTATN